MSPTELLPLVTSYLTPYSLALLPIVDAPLKAPVGRRQGGAAKQGASSGKRVMRAGQRASSAVGCTHASTLSFPPLTATRNCTTHLRLV